MKYPTMVRAVAFGALLFVFASLANAQQLTGDEIASRAAERSIVYTDTFKNLLSEEKKTFEIYDKKGEVKKRRTVTSTFLVYQLSKNDGTVAEFRNVTAVDGKPVANTDARATDFFEKVSATSSSQAELERIQQESTRYDEDFAINGLTLFPAVALSANLRQAFTFKLVGKENPYGRETYVVEYTQTKADASITVNSRGSNNYDIEIDGEAAELNPRMRGMLWIDTETFNVVRELRERTVQPQGFPVPVVVAQDIFEYRESEFGINTPTHIAHLQQRLRLKDRAVQKDTKITLEYGKFTRPDVEVKSSEVKGDKP